MSGTILILDSVATNRIVLKAVFQHARFSAIGCATVSEVVDHLTGDDSCVVVLPDSPDVTADCATIRAAAANAPMVVLAETDTPTIRMRALEAGASEVMVKPINEGFLIAAVRSLFKQRDTERDYCPDGAAAQALGFAEDSAAPLLSPGRVAVMAPTLDAGEALSKPIRALSRADVHVCPHGTAQRRAPRGVAPDVALIDGRDMYSADPMAPVFRLIPDLRARSETRTMAQIALFSAGREDLAAMALDLGADEAIAADSSPEEIANRVGRLLKRKLRADRLRETLRSGLEAALTDSLTGLHNRRYASAQLRRMSLTQGPLAVILADIDFFKRVNDTHGHAAGDAVLCEMAARVKPLLGGDDLIARIGGEEFLIALPGQDVVRAQKTAARLRDAIQATPFSTRTTSGEALAITISAGVAVTTDPLTSQKSVEDLLAQADEALYRAKRAGRNRVTVAGPRAA